MIYNHSTGFWFLSFYILPYDGELGHKGVKSVVVFVAVRVSKTFIDFMNVTYFIFKGAVIILFRFELKY